MIHLGSARVRLLWRVVLAGFACLLVGLLVGARTPGSAMSYNGGQVADPLYSMTSKWTPPLAAVSDEFTSDTSASWTLQAAGGTGTTVINPIATPTVSLFNFNTYRPGWLAMQAESATGIAIASKAYTLPTNVAAWARVKYGNRGVAPATGDGLVGIGFAATSGGAADTSNLVLCSPQQNVNGTVGRAIFKQQAGVLTLTTPFSTAAAMVPQYRDVVLIQKRSNTYYCYSCIDTSGACGWVGTATWSGVATLDRLIIATQNGVTTAPGPLTMLFDYIRVTESGDALP